MTPTHNSDGTDKPLRLYSLGEQPVTTIGIGPTAFSDKTRL